VPPIEVARLEELEPAVPKIVHAGDRRLVLVRVGDAVHALRDSCPHMAVSFAGAAVLPRVTGSPSEPRYEDGESVIACPWHRYEFSLADGRCLTADRLSMRTYAVMVDGGRVLVDLGRHADR
jgi:nitrite reductase/ring-hydroxylating ferredoxin subunit